MARSVKASMTAEAFITNLFDKDAVIFTNTGTCGHRQTTSEPRVIGLRLQYRWGKEEALGGLK